MRFSGAIIALAAMGSVASAAEIAIPVAEGTIVEEIEASYDCGDRTIDVTYINAGTVSLAVLDMDGESVVAANVISGSGARYAGGRYIWWNKGDEASLYDLMDGTDNTPAATCTDAS